jgi:hypothetical protein
MSARRSILLRPRSARLFEDGTRGCRCVASHPPKTLREPSKEENFRRGGRSARNFEGVASRRHLYVMPEGMTRKATATSGLARGNSCTEGWNGTGLGLAGRVLWREKNGRRYKVKSLREPSKEENFRRGGRSARDFKVRCCEAAFMPWVKA